MLARLLRRSGGALGPVQNEGEDEQEEQYDTE